MENNENEFTIGGDNPIACNFTVYASGTVWGNITGNIENQEDLKGALDSLDNKIDTNTSLINELDTTLSALSQTVSDNYITLDDKITTNARNIQEINTTINGYGDIVSHNASDFATAAQGELANTALQPNDNISELTNDAGYITSASLPTVNNPTITFQKNGTTFETITLNQSANETINYSIPTTASDVNAVPTTRTVNNKALSANISLDYTDVGALSSSTTINDLTTTAQQNALNSGATSTNIGQIATNTSAISTINGKIPSAATSSNQLADKEFVNSSISTNTANFIGTFADVSELNAYTGTVTNNDYAFVVNSVITNSGSDWATFSALDAYDKDLLTNFDYAWVINGSNFDLYRFDILNQEWDLRVSDTPKASVTLNTAYNRYKATVSGSSTSWGWEYTLNNSSFTAVQWAAINSGANTSNIAQIASNTSVIQEINTTISAFGDIVNYDAADFATAAQGSLASTALQPNDNVSSLTNDAGYITSSDVGNGTITFTQGGTAKGTITVNQSGDTTIAFDAGGAVDQTYNASSPNAQSGVAIAGAGFITGITSSDVTTALGYTPYNSSNPNGYTSNVGTVTSVNNVSPVSGNVTLSIPTTTDSITSGSSAALTSGGAYTNLITSVAAHATDDNKINVTKSGTTTTITINDVAHATAADSATSATTASKLGSSDVGSATQPIFLDDGTPTACTYSLAKSVPSDAIFTDTTYNAFTGADSITGGASGLVPAPSAGDENKFLKGNATWGAITFPTVDQTYNASSANAQSGTAVASAISATLGDLENLLYTINSGSST